MTKLSEFSDLDLIERYFDGDLEEHEIKAFEQRLKLEPDFKKEVDDYSLVFKGFKKMHLNNFEEQIKVRMVSNPVDYESGSKIISEPKVIPFWKNTAFRVAAGIAFITALYFSLSDQKPPISNNQILYAEFYERPETTNYLSEDGVISNTAEIWQSLVSNYEDENCEQVIKDGNSLKNKITDDYKNTNKMHLLMGSCLLEMGENKMAISNFKTISTDASFYFQTGEWYSSLAYLKSNDPISAKILIEKIAKNEDHPFNGEAKELMKKI